MTNRNSRKKVFNLRKKIFKEKWIATYENLKAIKVRNIYSLLEQTIDSRKSKDVFWI